MKPLSPALQLAVQVIESKRPTVSDPEQDPRLLQFYQIYGLCRRAFESAQIAENQARAAKMNVMQVLAEVRCRIELIEQELGIEDESELDGDGL